LTGPNNLTAKCPLSTHSGHKPNDRFRPIAVIGYFNDAWEMKKLAAALCWVGLIGCAGDKVTLITLPLSMADVDLVVPTSSPRVPSQDMGVGTVKLRCRVSTGHLSPCRITGESRAGLGAHAQRTIGAWEVGRGSAEPVEGRLIELELIYRSPHCISVAGTSHWYLQCVPY